MTLEILRHSLSASTNSQSRTTTEVLFLSSNNIGGSIPDYISRAANTLEGLYLSDNKLQGSIPTALCSLTELSKYAVREGFADVSVTRVSLCFRHPFEM